MELRDTLRDALNERRTIELVCDEAVYSCCGRGGRLRSGYEQTYRGRPQSLSLQADGSGHVLVSSKGIGTITYTVLVELAKVSDVRLL